MAQQSGPENSILVISYLSLRKAIGILGVALPFVLPIGQILLHALGIQSSLHSPVIANSVSSYYYTDMRNIFVGSMCAIGVFLMSYRGYNRRDALAGRFAFVCAIGVALFPTSPLPVASADEKLIGGIHLTFAALLTDRSEQNTHSAKAAEKRYLSNQRICHAGLHRPDCGGRAAADQSHGRAACAKILARGHRYCGIRHFLADQG